MAEIRSSTPSGSAGEAAGAPSDPARETTRNEEWRAPWVAGPEHPPGVANLQPPPQSSTGHYGPGYADPIRHYGDTLPGHLPAGERPAEPLPPDADAAPTADQTADERGERPDLRSEEVGFRPPDRLPSAGAPESENAALIFERS